MRTVCVCVCVCGFLLLHFIGYILTDLTRIIYENKQNPHTNCIKSSCRRNETDFLFSDATEKSMTMSFFYFIHFVRSTKCVLQAIERSNKDLVMFSFYHSIESTSWMKRTPVCWCIWWIEKNENHFSQPGKQYRFHSNDATAHLFRKLIKTRKRQRDGKKTAIYSCNNHNYRWLNNFLIWFDLISFASTSRINVQVNVRFGRHIIIIIIIIKSLVRALYWPIFSLGHLATNYLMTNNCSHRILSPSATFSQLSSHDFHQW